MPQPRGGSPALLGETSMKKQTKKLELTKETLRSLELKNVAAGVFDPDRSMNRACTYSSIALQPETTS
jgi:hypothetical protein